MRPGCNRPFLRMMLGSSFKTPTSLAMITRSSLVTKYRLGPLSPFRSRTAPIHRPSVNVTDDGPSMAPSSRVIFIESTFFRDPWTRASATPPGSSSARTPARFSRSREEIKRVIQAAGVRTIGLDHRKNRPKSSPNNSLRMLTLRAHASVAITRKVLISPL